MRGCASMLLVMSIIATQPSCVAAAPTSAPATVAPAPATVAATSAPAVDAQIDAILQRMENCHVNTLAADLKWTTWAVIDDPNDVSVNVGQIWYRQAKPVAQFKIHLTKWIVDGRMHDRDEQHFFDGRWYIKLDALHKQVTRTEIRGPNEPVNPYKLGEGPFPLPFGQKRADMLREFEITRLPYDPKDPNDTDHLRLVPRPDASTRRNWAEIQLWVARAGPLAGLPLRVKAVKMDNTGRADSHVTLDFSNVQLNAGVNEAEFKIDTPPGFNETIEPKEPVAPPATPASGTPPGAPTAPGKP